MNLIWHQMSFNYFNTFITAQLFYNISDVCFILIINYFSSILWCEESGKRRTLLAVPPLRTNVRLSPHSAHASMTHSIHYVRLYSSDMLIFASFHAPFSALWSNRCSKKDFYSNPVILPLLSACPSFDREQSCLFWMTIVFHILDANTCSSPIYYISADVFVWSISIASPIVCDLWERMCFLRRRNGGILPILLLSDLVLQSKALVLTHDNTSLSG